MNDWGGPIAIGGVGGSGTRVGAELLRRLGLYIGDDLNDPLDNLWFTLLFKRRDVLVDAPQDFAALVDLFWARMSGDIVASAATRARLLELAMQPRHELGRELTADWLCERAQSFLSQDAPRTSGPWGWKEPNTHVVVDRLLAAKPDLKYVHFFRHPLDLALSSNQNQLGMWGPIFLNRAVETGVRDSLAYWVQAHRRMTRIADSFPGRVLTVDFDRLCEAPEFGCAEIACFAGVAVNGETNSIGGFVDVARAGRGRFKGIDLRAFESADLKYVEELGYQVS